jgi:hypothetical protein
MPAKDTVIFEKYEVYVFFVAILRNSSRKRDIRIADILAENEVRNVNPNDLYMCAAYGRGRALVMLLSHAYVEVSG